ncbi:hypothetical protein OF83DRAFT_1109848 [Amylostereum chailletii]|nr:hypothetical protein OF83DRAFT_1109848 [Amylostereum chailletii]
MHRGDNNAYERDMGNDDSQKRTGVACDESPELRENSWITRACVGEIFRQQAQILSPDAMRGLRWADVIQRACDLTRTQWFQFEPERVFRGCTVTSTTTICRMMSTDIHSRDPMRGRLRSPSKAQWGEEKVRWKAHCVGLDSRDNIFGDLCPREEIQNAWISHAQVFLVLSRNDQVVLDLEVRVRAFTPSEKMPGQLNRFLCVLNHARRHHRDHPLYFQ